VNNDKKLINEMKKNEWETIKAKAGTYKSHDVLDIRIWTFNREGIEVPTKKGITMDLDLWPEFYKFIYEINKQVKVLSKEKK